MGSLVEVHSSYFRSSDKIMIMDVKIFKETIIHFYNNMILRKASMRYISLIYYFTVFNLIINKFYLLTTFFFDYF